MDRNETPKYLGDGIPAMSVAVQSVATAAPVRKVALYMYVNRVRSPTAGSTILTQRTKIETYCQTSGLSIVAEYCDQMSDSRPSWDRLLKNATIGGFDAVVVESFSRLGWGVRAASHRMGALNSLGVRLITVSNGELIDPTDHTAIERLLPLFDDYNARERGANISRKMAQNTRRGFFNGGIAPYGYQPVPVKAGPDMHRKRLAPKENEAAVVRTIFALFLIGHGGNGPMSIAELTKWLNDQGCRDRKGRRWNSAVVRKMLKNSIYKGEHRRKKNAVDKIVVLVPVPPVVSEQDFDAAQARLNK